MKNVFRFGIMSAMLNLASCSTLNEMKKITSAEPKNDSVASELVLMQAGAKAPTISASDEKKWLQWSQSAESSAKKLYGLLATGEWQAAAEEARRELEKQPGDPGLMVALASAYAIGRNYETAAYYSAIALKSNATSSDAMNLIGLRLMMQPGNRRGDYDDAIAMFRKATENDGTQLAAPLNMGYLQLDMGDSQAAVESFNTAANRCERCFAAQYGFGLALMRTNAWEPAKSAFENILSKDKTKAAAQYQLALVYNQGFNDQTKGVKLLQGIVSDADGRFKDSGKIKRAANVTLRKWKASDRSGPPLEETTEPHGGELPARAE